MKNRGLLFTALLFLTVLTISSCRTKDDTIAIVTVRDINSDLVPNARVVLYGSGTEGVVNLYDTVYTNNSGEAIFNFNDRYQLGQAGFAVLDIEVEHAGEYTYAIIKIVEETTNKKLVNLGQ